MEASVDPIKLSQTAKDQLTKLKRVTKISQQNVLCRWALCLSLAEPSPPSTVPIPADSAEEISWQELGEYPKEGIAKPNVDQLLIALKQRCHNDELGTNPESLATQLRLHLHRGIGYLASDPNIKSVEYLIEKALETTIC